MTRRLLPLALLAAAAVVLTGCFVLPVVKDEKGAQRDLIGDVRLDTTSCPFVLPFSGSPFPIGPFPGGGLPLTAARKQQRDASGPPCTAKDDILEALGNDDAVSLPQQILVAYRVPKGTRAPDTLSAHLEVAEPTIAPFRAVRELKARGLKARKERLLGRVGTPDVLEGDAEFTRVDGMQEAMEAFYHGDGTTPGPIIGPSADVDLVGPGQEIVGYISEPVPGAVVNDVELRADFGLPGGSDAKPFTGPFNHQAFVGMRIAIPDSLVPGPGDNPLDPDRPVDCVLSNPAAALCPLPRVQETSLEDSLKGTDLVTRDLRIAQGPYASGRQGGTATVPFKLLGAGPAGGGDLALSATTTIPGATATPRDATLPFPGTGEFDQPVTIEIPENAAPGEYQVELVAKVVGQLRRAVGLVTVLAKEVENVPPPPPIDEKTKPDKLYVENSGNLAFGYVCRHAEGECEESEGVYYQNPSTIPGLKAAAAAKSRKFKMHRLGRKRFTGHKNARSRVKLRLYRSPRVATLKKGKTLRGLLVIRSGGKSTVPTVRRVTIRKRRK